MKIDKGIKLVSNGKYPSPKNMEIGDSFLVESKEEKDRLSAFCSMKVKSKKLNLCYEFKSRKVDGGFRIWRVK